MVQLEKVDILPMIDYVKSWLSYIQLRNSNPSYRSYTSAMRLFLDSLPMGVKVRPIHIENFLQIVVQTHKVSTTNTYLMILKSFYNWMENYHGFPNIAKSVSKLKAPEIQRRIITDAEYKRILETIKGNSRKAVQFLANTGLRRNEFRFLKWSNFNGDFLSVNGKGSKQRIVPLNHICKKIIGSNRSGSIPAFVEPFLPYNNIYNLCERIRLKTHIPPFTPHSFRHYFATRLIKAGVPLIIVSKILGHSDTQTTERIYVHLVSDDLRVTDCLIS